MFGGGALPLLILFWETSLSLRAAGARGPGPVGAPGQDSVRGSKHGFAALPLCGHHLRAWQSRLGPHTRARCIVLGSAASQLSWIHTVRRPALRARRRARARPPGARRSAFETFIQTFEFFEGTNSMAGFTGVVRREGMSEEGEG
eukprot:747591-Hanusia_phi.AAC.11